MRKSFLLASVALGCLLAGSVPSQGEQKKVIQQVPNVMIKKNVRILQSKVSQMKLAPHIKGSIQFAGQGWGQGATCNQILVSALEKIVPTTTGDYLPVPSYETITSTNAQPLQGATAVPVNSSVTCRYTLFVPAGTEFYTNATCEGQDCPYLSSDLGQTPITLNAGQSQTVNFTVYGQNPAS